MNLMCPMFPVFFSASRQGIHSRMAELIRHIEIRRPVQMWVDEAAHFGTSMVEINIDGIKHWSLAPWLCANEVTMLAESVRLALGVALDDGWVPKLDSDYVKESAPDN